MSRTKRDILLELWQHISCRRRKQFILLLFLTLAAALSEMISLGAALPFISVVTDPDKLLNLPLLESMFRWLGIASVHGLIVPLSIAFGFAALLAGALRLALTRASIWIGNMTGADLGSSIYCKTLYQPYHFHVAQNSSEAISGITQKVGAATSILIAIVTFTISLILCVAITVSLLMFSPVISVMAMMSFGLLYSLIAWCVRYRLARNSRIIAEQQTRVIRILQEGLGAIRDVLLGGGQVEYVRSYRKAVLKQQQASSENAFMNQAPRYIVEAFAMLLVALFVFVMSLTTASLVLFLPVLAVLALGAQRLLPLMQQIYANWSTVTGNMAGLVDVLDLLKQPLPSDAHQPLPKPLRFRREICFRDVSFRYGPQIATVLHKVSLTIPKGARVGIIGATGSGKSTMLDILMSLLEPTQGELQVDGVRICEENRRAWQSTIAHVPQAIFLSDASIAENIAFGVPLAEIDNARVCEAADRAHASQFILDTPDGYHTVVGERGIRLSGGQRQRIGIARALYKHATVLCFDEATSALDSDTESEVMKAVDELDTDLTIIMIAHRLTTLKNCTHILDLDRGRIKFFGPRTYIETELVH